MKLETSQDLLNRVRARHHTSWYGLIRLMDVHKNTVYSWKGGHTVIDRKFVPKIAELLDEPEEYVLACLEADREQDAQMLKVWERIAAKFRGHAASILLVGFALFGVGSATKAEAFDTHAGSDVRANVYYVKLRYQAAGSGCDPQPKSPRLLVRTFLGCHRVNHEREFRGIGLTGL